MPGDAFDLRYPHANHSKCIVRRNGSGGGWIYAGSANASQPAFGALKESMEVCAFLLF
jgi:hypothetical protein